MKSDANRVWNHPVKAGYAKASGIVATSIVAFAIFTFYLANQVWSTGLFTSGFTPLLAGVFYTSVLWTIVNAASKAITPRKDVVALVELIGSVLFAVVAAWFFVVFPLNFAHLADLTPAPLQFLVSWITNDIGKILVALIFLASIVALSVNAVKLAWRVSAQRFAAVHDVPSGM